MGSRVSMRGIIFWNFRGLGSSSTINALCSLVRKYSPEIVFLSERKSNKREIRRVQDRLRFDKSVCVEACGRARGLALFWMEELDISNVVLNDHYIDCTVSTEDGCSWRLSGVYGWPENGKKFWTWDMLNNLGSNYAGPWVLGVILMKCSKNRKSGVALGVISVMCVLSGTVWI